MNKPVIFYHADCADGFGGAFAAWKKFGKRAEYIPLRHHQREMPKLVDCDMYLIDIVFPEHILKHLLTTNRSVTILDHHVSAKPLLEFATRSVYALNHSGAVIAWTFFHPEKPLPKLLQYVEERDLWKFKSPKVREILASIDLEPQTFASWNKLARELETPAGRKKHTDRGVIVRATEGDIVAKLAKRVEETHFGGFRAGVVNSPTLRSEIGHAICKMGYQVAIVWFRQDGVVHVSLRSEGSVDVSKLAQMHGGGGHKHAAGFELNAKQELPWQ